MQNEIVSFRVYPLEPTDQVISIGVVQLNRNSFAAQFSVAVSGNNNFEPPMQCQIGSPVYIEAGYNDNLQELFAGKITEVELNSSEALGVYYTFKCQSNRDKQLMQSANAAFRPELGVNVLSLNLTNNGNKTAGNIKVQGTRDIWYDDEVDLSGIGRLFEKSKAGRVRHIITDGAWTTEVFMENETPADDTGTVVLQTPKGNSIVLDDTTNSIVLKDTVGNSIKMGMGGIEITSGNEITTQADYIKQVSKGKQIIKAEGELRLEGRIVNIN